MFSFDGSLTRRISCDGGGLDMKYLYDGSGHRTGECQIAYRDNFSRENLQEAESKHGDKTNLSFSLHVELPEEQHRKQDEGQIAQGEHS